MSRCFLRSCVSRTLDVLADACLSLALRLSTLRDRLNPTEAIAPDVDAVWAGVCARLTPSFEPSATEKAAAHLADGLNQTVWIQRTATGTVAACNDQRGRS